MIALAERGLLPDPMLRAGIRRLLRQRLRDETAGDPALVEERKEALVARMRASPIAVATDDANRQHYEVPAEFFRAVLGPRLKYSACLWDEPVGNLADAEKAMLRLTCERAGLRDGMRVIDLGCGWGSLALWVGEHYPTCRVTAVSNSSAQREFILGEARRRGVDNVEVVTADANGFEPVGAVDRVISVEMFEHMRNYERLLERIASWLLPGGKLFVHIFCHRQAAYFFETDGRNDWMARHFFTGGLMPSVDLFDRFGRDLAVERHWTVDGRHYERTLLAWLDRMDRRRDEVMRILRRTYGPTNATVWYRRWRIFFLACAELFGYREGREWFVEHYLLAPAAG